MLEFTLADQMADLPPVLTSSGQEWQFQASYKQINWQIYPLPKCIMGYILWDVFGSHCGFFKKRWGFSFISELFE